MNKEIFSALQQIKNNYGMGIFADSRRLDALLSDLLKGQYEGEREFLLRISNTDITQRMLRGESFSANDITWHADLLSQKYFLHKDMVQKALLCWQNITTMKTGKTTSQMPATGRGVSQNIVVSAHTHVKNATQANLAQNHLQAAAQGDVAAQFELAQMYETGQGMGQSYILAFQWYEKAADQWHAVAQYRLGELYRKGLGIQQNDVLAVHWLTKSAGQGCAEAQNVLGGQYDAGLGVQQDNFVAATWFKKAAEQGLAAAQFNLALMYINGRGVPQDKALAEEWLEKSAAQGDAGAQQALDRLYKNTTSDENSSCSIVFIILFFIIIPVLVGFCIKTY